MVVYVCEIKYEVSVVLFLKLSIFAILPYFHFWVSIEKRLPSV